MPSKIILLIALTLSLNAHALEDFGVEEPLQNQIPISASIISELSYEVDLKKNGCTETNVADALEATRVSLSAHPLETIIKPKSRCLCGAYYCPVWIYQEKNKIAKRLWSSPGTGFVEILDRKNKGYRQIRESGGTAGHGYKQLWVWDGKKYRLVVNKSHLVKGEEK